MDKQELQELPSTYIDEFRMLNEAVNELTRKNKEVFENQKQFIEDASHELQTPLSIIQSKLEALVSRTTLTAEQAAIVDSIIGSTQRLKKLNKTLLLLAKIENSQFLMTDEVNVNGIIGRSLEYYDEQKNILNIKMKINIRKRVVISGNKMLTEILIQNLLKNAFLHNVEDGMVDIKLDKKQLVVTNSGNQKSISQKGCTKDLINLLIILNLGA
ncbi:histidine kinase dimerization/phospho-acceptor domain-containing protein [Gramella sp. MT6]|uniref:sensor histidine kinase n=1 Tax=Gramella sp. MT6 TaxID=2705471 RepID=UPI001C607597|nr:histidine kinase dimerization/phospho-acceptor domain-containing protein [Gramella sp. MT6]